MRLFSDFDTLGHMDYIVRYAPDPKEYDPHDFFEITDEIFKFIIDKNIALEVNTSALKTSYGVINPSPVLLKRYKELGGSLLTVGSDAHSPEYQSFGFDEVAELLCDLGFREYATFEKRNMKLHAIDAPL